MKLQAAIEGFLVDWELRQRSPGTIRLYRSCLMVLARWLEEQGVTDAEEVTIAHLRAFMLHTKQRPASSVNPNRPAATNGQPPTTSTLQSYVKAIKVLFRWLVEEEVITRNPALRLQKPVGEKRVRASFTHEHLNALFETCDLNTPLGFRDYVIMLTLLDTGVRVSELCSIPLSEVHAGYLKVYGKGRKEREVGVSPTTAKFLWKYINQFRVAEDDTVTALFTNFAGRPLQPSGVEKIVQRAKEAAGITDAPVTPHKFRHTFARSWLEHGGEVYSLSRLLGHSSVKITEIYLEDFTSRQARVHHAKYSPLSDMRIRKKGTGRHHYRRQPKLTEQEDDES